MPVRAAWIGALGCGVLLLSSVSSGVAASASSGTLAERGLASWYGPGFQFKPTANGEPYDMYLFTAAHRTLPLPSYVLVRNLKNGRQVLVVVNDRGPFIEERIIDLSYAAAVQLDMVDAGITEVEILPMTAEQIADLQFPPPDPEHQKASTTDAEQAGITHLGGLAVLAGISQNSPISHFLYEEQNNSIDRISSIPLISNIVGDAAMLPRPEARQPVSPVTAEPQPLTVPVELITGLHQLDVVPSATTAPTRSAAAPDPATPAWQNAVWHEEPSSQSAPARPLERPLRSATARTPALPQFAAGLRGFFGGQSRPNSIEPLTPRTVAVSSLAPQPLTSARQASAPASQTAPQAISASVLEHVKKAFNALGWIGLADAIGSVTASR